jgi:predicted O-methyltransferase YrrM
LLEKHSYYIFQQIENLRNGLKKDSRAINITDFGTGSNRTETVSAIANKSVKSVKYGQLLFRMVHYFKAQNVLELGTSLGITTSYLAASSSEIRCVSLEGCPEIANIANENFDKLALKNIQIVVGDINNTLVDVVSKTNKLDFVFIDANHKLQATLDYFGLCLTRVHPDTVIVIDDIHYSKEMEKAWGEIKNHPQVTSTIDLFQVGIVFFNTDLHKKHYKMRY